MWEIKILLRFFLGSKSCYPENFWKCFNAKKSCLNDLNSKFLGNDAESYLWTLILKQKKCLELYRTSNLLLCVNSITNAMKIRKLFFIITCRFTNYLADSVLNGMFCFRWNLGLVKSASVFEYSNILMCNLFANNTHHLGHSFISRWTRN